MSKKNIIREIRQLKLKNATMFMYRNGLRVEPKSIDVEARTVTVFGDEDINSTFCFPEYADSQLPYMLLFSYEDNLTFIAEAINFLSALDDVFESANMFRTTDFIETVPDWIMGMITPLADYIDFIEQYEQCGFPMWNDMDNFKKLLYQARALNNNEVLQ